MTNPPDRKQKAPPRPKPVTAQWLRNASQFYLSQRMASERQLTDALKRKAQRRSGEKPDDAVLAMIAETVAGLRLAGLLDDAAYAEARTASLKRKGVSASGARVRLAAKGIERSLAADAVTAAGFDEAEQIRTVARKLRIGPWSREGVEPGPKDIARLARRGFGLDAIRRALQQRDGDELEG